MQITPLSLIARQTQSPQKVVSHHDSLIFSITSEKYDARIETLLLDQSKEIKKSNEQKPKLKDYFFIQDKIKLLEEKVSNIKTQFCDSENLHQSIDLKDEQKKSPMINIQFPEEIYQKLMKQNDSQNEIGKIKKRKPTYYTGIQSKIKRKLRSNSNSNHKQSINSTHRNNLTTYQVNDFSLYRGKNNSFRKVNQNDQNDRNQSRQKSSSYSLRKNISNLAQANRITSMKKIRQELAKNRLINERLSKKSKQSQKKLSLCKDQIQKLAQQNSKYQKQIVLLKQKLKNSETIKQRQKQTIQKQKNQIFELKSFLQQFLKRNNLKTYGEVCKQQNSQKFVQLRTLR